MWWRRSTERVRTVSLFIFHLGAGDGLFVVGVGFVFGLCFVGLAVCLLLLCLWFSLVHHTLLHTQVMKTQVVVKWALDFLLGRSTSGVACFTPS